METETLIIIGSCVGFLLIVALLIFCCCFCKRKKQTDHLSGEALHPHDTSEARKGYTFKNIEEIKIGEGSHHRGSLHIQLPKLPPKGEEADVPLPAAFRNRYDPGLTAPISPFKKEPRPKHVPQPGHTHPVRPADEDPTMPVEDDMLAYKMAALNRPSTPPPPCPRR